MYTLSKLFHLCAYETSYTQAGDSVNYAFKEEGSTLYIFFEGSNSISDWVRNFWFFKKPYKDMKIPYRVHGGFLAAWKTVEDIIIKKVTEVKSTNIIRSWYSDVDFIDRLDYKFNKIVIVGYSHGGALTFFAVESIWFHRPDLRNNGFAGYAFESPRVLSAFKVPKNIEERWSALTVIRCSSDIVTHCPPTCFRFTHTGKLLTIKGDYKLIDKKIPRCVKYHYPQVVYQALLDYEKGLEND